MSLEILMLCQSFPFIIRSYKIHTPPPKPIYIVISRLKKKEKKEMCGSSLPGLHVQCCPSKLGFIYDHVACMNDILKKQIPKGTWAVFIG